MYNIKRSKKNNNLKGNNLKGNNITKTIKNMLGQYTVVSKKTIPVNTQNVLNRIQNENNNIKNAREVNNLTENLINTCNKILIKKESQCQCYNKKKYPTKNFRKCEKKNNKFNQCNAYNKCRKIFASSLNGDEPTYSPESWEDPLVEGTHNCYMYFLNDQEDSLRHKCVKICKDNGKNNSTCKSKKQNSCSNLKPQPGDYAHLKGNFKGNRRIYSCPAMIDKVLKDNYKKGTKKSNILHWNNLTLHQQFIKKCPKNYYKGVLVVHPGNTYHFYRQDRNGRYSHKQGTLRVENVDASKKPIYVPHLSDMNYSKGSNNGINYTDFCGYMCVPKNSYIETKAD